MFNKNVFTQTDPVADLIRGINEADYKAKMEALKGDQHKIDKNKNNKIDAHDFKILRGEKKVNEEDLDEDSNVKIPTPTGTRVLGHRYGNAAKTHRDSLADPFAVVRGPGQKDMEALGKKMAKKEEIDPNVTTTDTLTGRVNGRSANPFLKAKVKLNVNEEDLEEAKFNPLKHIDKKNQTPAIVAAAKLVDRGSYGQRAALNKAGGVKDDRGPRGVTQEEAELDEANSESEKDFKARQERLAAAAAQTAKDPARLKRMMSIPGYSAAMGLANKTTTKEEVEELDELSKSTLGSYYNKADQHIDTNTQVLVRKVKAGDTKAANRTSDIIGKRMDGMDRAEKRLNREEVEELDELSKTTLGSYAKKASRDAVITRKIGADFENQAKKARSPGMKAASGEISQKYKEKSWKRRDGIDKAVDRLTKEEAEMNERSLSPAEKDAVEVNVMSMKKNLAGFKARYGKDAKSVMYATATKQAKKD